MRSFSCLQKPLLLSIVATVCALIGFSRLRSACSGETVLRQQGRLIVVPLPLTGDADDRVIRMVRRAIEDFPLTDESDRILVFEFRAKRGEKGKETDFSRAAKLADFLTSAELSGITTVAYLPETIYGHSVLVAMACDEIHMAGKAHIGKAGIAQKAIEETHRGQYKKIAARRNTIPTTIAMGMLDRDLRVDRVVTEQGLQYLSGKSPGELRQQLDALKEKTVIIEAPKTIIEIGQFGDFSGDELRRNRWSKYKPTSRADVAKVLNLPSGSLIADPSLDADWIPVRIYLDKRINNGLVNRQKSIIEEQITNKGVNFICVQIDCPGGDIFAALEMASFLAEIHENYPSEVRTVAYVPKEAVGVSALIAVACDQLVMGPGATLGGSLEDGLTEKQLDAARTTIRETIARQKSWSMIVALVDEDLEVFQYKRRTKNDVLIDYYSQEEFETLGEGLRESLTKQDIIKAAGKSLKLVGAKAVEYDLAYKTVENFEQFKDLYGLTEDPPDVRPGWIRQFVEALASPPLRIMLVMIGFFAMYGEIQAPGTGIGGFIATVCFVLFFWSYALEGHQGWLGALLFAVGIGCMVLEVFVLPGFGVFGIGGGALVLAGLVVAGQSVDLSPGQSRVEQFVRSGIVVGSAIVGFMGLAFLLRRFLPYTPLLSRVLLVPPSADENQQRQLREAPKNRGHLIGQLGKTLTQLTPSGSAQFGDDIVQVISEGAMIERGASVIVREVRGNHVIVETSDY